jgi:ABC-type phosphate/phosphonate transport system substrate-binding protein
VLPVMFAAAAPPPGDRLDFIVSQQNSQQLTGWYYLNTLLQRTLGRTVSLSVEDFEDGAASGRTRAQAPALVFARPFDACALMQQHGYLPVTRPQDDCDEVSLIVRHDDTRAALTDFAGAQVVTALERSFVFVLGRFLCDECGLDSAGLPRRFAGGEIAALKMLLSGQAELLFMSSRGHERLSALARAGTRVLERSETRVASHLMLLHPSCQALVQPLRQALTGLGGHDKGRQALQDLGMNGWDVPAPEEVEMLLMLYRRYAG